MSLLDDIINLYLQWKQKFERCSTGFKANYHIEEFENFINIIVLIKCTVSNTDIEHLHVRINEDNFYKLKQMLNKLIQESQKHIDLCPNHITTLEVLEYEVLASSDDDTFDSEEEIE